MPIAQLGRQKRRSGLFSMGERRSIQDEELSFEAIQCRRFDDNVEVVTESSMVTRCLDAERPRKPVGFGPWRKYVIIYGAQVVMTVR